MIYRIADNILSPLGETTAENYRAVREGRTALRRYEHHWGLPDPFTASMFDQQRGEEGLTRFESLAVCSVRKALQQTELDVSQPNVLFILSTTKGNIELLSDPSDETLDVSPGTAARHIAQTLGITTEPIVVCNACISGVAAIILAERLLTAGSYDYAIVCGADVLNKFTVSGFQSLQAISADECKPFDLERTGLNLGEAAATIIFCRQPHADNGLCSAVSPPKSWAIERGAIRNDAFHISSPSKNGEGARLALVEARGDVAADELAMINAHGTATLFNDQMESVAIERAGLQTVPVNALKGYFGHTLGAAGILETILTMTALDDHTVLATRGFEERGVSGKILLSPQHQPTDKHRFIKMISGFGGGNAAIFVRTTDDGQRTTDNGPLGFAACYRRDARTTTDDGQTVISGLPADGVRHHVHLTPDRLMIDGVDISCEETGMALLTSLYKSRIHDYPKFYKMDPLSRLGFVASELLLQAEGKERFVPCKNRAVILFNHSSSISADRKYLASIADADNYYPSPSVFVYTLPNIVTGEIAIRNGYQGETSFYILPQKDESLMQQIVRASFLDQTTQDVICGWVDYEDEDHFEATVTLKIKH